MPRAATSAAPCAFWQWFGAVPGDFGAGPAGDFRAPSRRVRAACEFSAGQNPQRRRHDNARAMRGRGGLRVVVAQGRQARWTRRQRPALAARFTARRRLLLQRGWADSQNELPRSRRIVTKEGADADGVTSKGVTLNRVGRIEHVDGRRGERRRGVHDRAQTLPDRVSGQAETTPIEDEVLVKLAIEGKKSASQISRWGR